MSLKQEAFISISKSSSQRWKIKCSVSEDTTALLQFAKDKFGYAK